MPAQSLPYSEHDIFRGFVEDDLALVERIVDRAAEPTAGVYTDALGIKVEPALCPWIADKVGTRASGLPLPSDGYIGDGMEYVALSLALEWAAGRGTFVVGEMGAGWGPWVSAAARTALRTGFRQAHIMALEADGPRFQHLRHHLDLNEIVPASADPIGSAERLTWNLRQAALGEVDGVLHWPTSDDPLGAGRSAVTDLSAPHHYTGEDVSFIEVQAVSLETMLTDVEAVDLLHVDIQGSEATVLPSAIDLLNRKVRTLFVGTHSRKIEGDFIEFFRSHGWMLSREKPCQFYTMLHGQDLASSTYVDGGQFWRNNKLF